MKVVAIGDTHGKHDDLDMPDGDLLIHTGDMSDYGDISDIDLFNYWLGTLDYKDIVVIAGNHDMVFEKQPAAARAALTNAIYLQDTWTDIGGYIVYGTPWTPHFNDWAFNRKRGLELREVYDKIPEQTDILVSHGPAWRLGDWVKNRWGVYEHAGSKEMLRALVRVRPKYHIFGHIHVAYGQYMAGDITCLNVSSINKYHEIANPPVVFEL